MRKISIFVFFMALMSSAARAEQLKTIDHNKEGIRHLEQEDAVAAEKSFLRALAEDPFHPLLHLNLGLTYEVQKHYDRALKEYEAVTRQTQPPVPSEILFYAHFNAGNAAAQMQNLPRALSHYQAALDIKPDSIETKTNIELLMQASEQGQKGGGGQGDKDKKDQSEGDGDDPNQDKNQRQNKPQEKPKFNSENLTKEDVRKILEELKAQEQKIRALEYGTKGKESAPEKDW